MPRSGISTMGTKSSVAIAVVLVLFAIYAWSSSRHQILRNHGTNKKKLDDLSLGVVSQGKLRVVSANDTKFMQFSQSGVRSLDKFVQPTNTSNVESLIATYQAEILYSGLGNLFRVGENVYRTQLLSKDGREFRLAQVDSCRMSTLLDVFELSQNSILPVDHLLLTLNPNNNFSLSVESVSIDRSFMETESQILIVYTTCNQLPMTILSLQFLRNTDKLADLVVIDDHSTDGTVEYLRKKGFAVITKPKATGLTDSWNIGYRLAVALGYKHVVFTNNDVLLTTGSVALMYQGLRDYGLVVPLTTEKGAGHHPAQVRTSGNI